MIKLTLVWVKILMLLPFALFSHSLTLTFKTKDMRNSLFIFSTLLFAGIGFLFIKTSNETFTIKHVEDEKASNVIACAPDAVENIYAGNDGKFIGVMPGWGNHFYKISTNNDSAQFYFDQGLTMYYSYHAREAVASFKEASKFDSTCAMTYWGQALAMGPAYNGGYSYKMRKDVPAVIQRMNSATSKVSDEEKDLIDAMNLRYNTTDTTDKQRKQLNTMYAGALQPLVAKYPADLDVKALYTDAVMLIHAWDFWNNDGTAKAWTPELVANCQDIIKQDPHHPAGLHYYIHVTEASRDPNIALSSADSLIKLFPGIAHMVHMSSHEYERIGYYAKGVDANEKADKCLVAYDALHKGMYPVLHSTHYFAVDAYCALSGAMYSKAIPKALACRHNTNPTHEDNTLQYAYMFPELAMVRMGKWQDIITDTANINGDWSYARLLSYFAKGMAYAKTGNTAQADNYLKQLKKVQEDSILKVKEPTSSSAYEASLVAENILSANILFQNKAYDEALTTIKKAIRAEDSLIYSEPKEWMLPARQYLGAFLLKLNKSEEAEKVYREDLVWNPGNGWSLLGLYQSLEAQQKSNELDKLKQLYTHSFSQADVLPTGSAY
jgi:tetratricopeptide (TPR) repeat protein